MIEIRRARKEDAAQIADVHVIVWQVAYRTLVPDLLLDNLSVERRRVFWAQTLAHDTADSDVFVALEGERLLGFTSIGPSRDPDAAAGTAELTTLYLLPEAWGTGVGYRLYQEAEAFVRRQGFTEITLWVLHDNERGIRFYERVGFARDATPSGLKIEQAGDVLLREVRYRLSIQG